MMKKFAFCFDITDDRRRVKICRVLLEYGIRTQMSFFEGELKETDLKKMVSAVKHYMATGKDVFYVFPLQDGDRFSVKRAGKNVEYLEADDIYI